MLIEQLKADKCGNKPSQVLFLPADNGIFYDHHISGGSSLNPEGLPNQLQALVDTYHSEQAKTAKIRPRIVSSNCSMIDKVNNTFDIENLLLSYGYKKIGKKWLHPNNSSKQPGIILLDGKYYSHHSSDPLNDGYKHDVFDLLVHWRFEGNEKEALATLSNELDPDGQKQRQREFMQSENDSDIKGVTGVVSEPYPKNAAQFVEPEIIELNDNLPPVMKFDYALLPTSLHDWVKDIAERVQCPVDFLAVGVMVGIAGIVGRKVGIYPKQYDDWYVVPNLWGALIGRPSIMKTPALNEVLKPIYRLIQSEKNIHQKVKYEYEAEAVYQDAHLKHVKAQLEKAIKSKGLDRQNEIEIAKNEYERILRVSQENKPPKEKRYIVNDTTVEKLGELLNDNPNGLTLVRDELIGWLRKLDREDTSNDRAFYLECFNGSGKYTYDRIGRGTIEIESTCVSIIGGIQPSKLMPYTTNAIEMGSGDDGFIQRLQLAVFPNDPKEWLNVDRYPDKHAKEQAEAVYEKLASLMCKGDNYGLHFSEDAQPLFNDWREDLENEIRQDDIHPALESHYAKYRSLVPTIALLLSLADNPNAETVDAIYLQKAINWSQYLKSHALRIYNGCIEPEVIAAKRVIKDRDKLPDLFKLKELQQKGWSGMNKTESARKAVNVLVDHGYLVEQSNTKGNRPNISYRWNKNLNVA